MGYCYIVVIKKAGVWGCWGGAILPVFVIRRLSNSVKICFGYHTDLGDVKGSDL